MNPVTPQHWGDSKVWWEVWHLGTTHGLSSEAHQLISSWHLTNGNWGPKVPWLLIIWNFKKCFSWSIFDLQYCVSFRHTVKWFGTRGSLVAQRLKPLPAMRETWVHSLGREDPLEKEMATHSSTLTWKSSWTEEPGRLQSTGSQKIETTERLHFHFHMYISIFFYFFSITVYYKVLDLVPYVI